MTTQDSTQAGGLERKSLGQVAYEAMQSNRFPDITAREPERWANEWREWEGDHATQADWEFCAQTVAATHASQQAAVVAAAEGLAVALLKVLSFYPTDAALERAGHGHRYMDEADDAQKDARAALAAYHAMKEKP